MKAKTIALFANPYHGLDAMGRLAGACPVGELPRPAGSLPSRQCVGAERTMTGGSYVPDSADQGLRIAVADRGGNLAIAPFIMSTADVFWQFDGEAHEYHIGDRRLEHFYSERVKHGEVFEAEADGSAPIAKLAKARAAAIASWKAHYGDEPLPLDVWAKQYPLESVVAGDKPAKSKAPAAPVIASDTTKGS